MAITYYSKLAAEGAEAGQPDTVSYAEYAEHIIKNDTEQARFVNEYANVVATEGGEDMTYGSDNWLQVQYDQMQADLDERIESIDNEGTGELDYSDYQDVTVASYANVSVSPDASTTLTPLSQLAQHDPGSAQGLFNNWIDENGGLLGLLGDSTLLAFGANIDGEQGLPGILSDWADQAGWMKNMLDTLENMLAAQGELSPEVQDFFDDLQDFFDPGGPLVTPTGWLEDILGWVPENLSGWLPGAKAPFDAVPDQESPLVLDLDGDGIELTQFDTLTTTTFFDIDANGFAEQTAWVGADDGLLARDLNGDGLITDRTELFGGAAVDGFAILAGLDTNGDLVINAADAEWNDLRIWVDADGDAATDSGELHTLSAYNIASIDLAGVHAPDPSAGETEEIAGNAISHISSYTLTDGTERDIVDAWFTHDNVNSFYNGDYTLDVRTLFLPTLRGYGELPDLHIAMSQNETLLDLVTAFATSWTPDKFAGGAALDAELDAILFAWAGAQDPSPVWPYDPAYLQFLEAQFGVSVRDHPFARIHAGWAAIDESWHLTTGNLKAHLLVQIGAQSLFSGPVTYNPVSGEIEGDLTLSQTEIDALVARATAMGVDTQAYWVEVAEFLQFAKGYANFTAAEDQIMDAAIVASDPALSWQDIKDITTFEPVPLNVHGTPGDVDEVIHGTAGDNDMIGYGGDDTLYGYEGNDTLQGDFSATDVGDDVLRPGLGNDFAYGAKGSDTYVYEGGDDFYSDRESGDIDRIELPSGITLSDLSFERSVDDNLMITIGTLGSVEIEQHFWGSGQYTIEEIVFADSTVYDLLGMTTMTTYGTSADDSITGVTLTAPLDDTVFGLDGDDLIQTSGGNDTIDGGAGNDTLYGDTGDDVYIASAGFDRIIENTGNDIIRMPEGIDQGDVYILRDPTSFTSLYHLKIITTGLGEILVDGHYSYQTATQMEKIEFFDGSEIDLLTLDVETRGDSGNNTLTGNEYAGGQNDILNPLGGNDYVSGLLGSDTFIYTSGLDEYVDGGGIDVLKLPQGIGDLAYLTFTEIGNALHLVWTPGVDEIELTNHLSPQYPDSLIETLLFHDGFSLNLARYKEWVFGTVAGERIDGSSGTDDILLLGAGDDTSYGNTGADTIHGGDGADLLAGNEDNDQLHGGEGDDTVRGSEGDDILFGGDGNDTLYGEHNSTDPYEGDDTLDGGAGNDILRGGLGDDTYIASAGLDYIYDRGGLDTLVLGASVRPEDLSFLTDPSDTNDLIVVIDPGVDEIAIENQKSGTTTTHIEQALFADGFTADLSRYDVWTFGTIAGEQLDGTSGFDDILFLGDGDDTSYGDTGDDAIHGGKGSDILNGDDGNDNLHGGEGDDNVYGRNDNDLIHGGEGDDDIRGGAGDDTVLGDEGNDTLYGDQDNSDTYAGTDILDGGIGNDTLRGGLGNDLYLVSEGQDYVYDRSGTDTLQYGAGIVLEDLLFSVDASDINDLLIDLINSSSQIHIENQLSSTSGVEIETLAFADGSWATLASYGDWMFGSALGETLNGSHSVNDTILGYEGDDSLYGKDGDDELFGGEGDDYLRAGNDHDLLVGGAGDDDLRGDAGDDVLMAGSGADRLQGDAGADTFFLQGEGAVDGNLNRVVDFSDTEGDSITLSDVLIGYDPLQDSINDFITLAETSHTYVNIDRDGTGGAFTSKQAIRIEYVTGQWTDAEDMINQGHLTVV